MGKKIKARVLVDVRIEDVLYRSDQHVVEIDSDVAKGFIKDGALDDAAAAVEYALGEGGAKLVKHEKPVAEAAAQDAPAETSPV